jgi:hypothetical protein
MNEHEPGTESANPLTTDAGTTTPPAEVPATGTLRQAQGDHGEPEPPEEGEQTVPLARLQGVQRALSQAERERDALHNESTALRQQLDTANARAAQEYAERLRTTQRDIVPDLIRGETIEQVDASLSASRAAFAAARQAYARTIPTPSVGNPPHSLTQPSTQQPTGSPVQLISFGLRQPPTDINR